MSTRHGRQKPLNNRVWIIILVILTLFVCHKEEKTKIGDDIDPIWSPDGRFIAFNRVFHVLIDPPLIEDSISGMRLFNLRTGRIEDSVISFFCSDWFRNGTEIISFTGVVYDFSTQSFRSMFDTSFHYSVCDVSPNGKKVLCVKKSVTADSFMIVMTDTLGVESKVLFSSGLAPSWHPSGDKLVFIGTFNNKKHICIGDTSGNIIRLIEVRDGELIAYAGYGPKFSPDGSKICYYLQRYGGGLKDFYIHICDSLGENDVELIDGFHPSWSPGGSEIVFARYSDDEEAPSLWIINSNGSNLKRITHP